MTCGRCNQITIARYSRLLEAHLHFVSSIALVKHINFATALIMRVDSRVPAHLPGQSFAWSVEFVGQPLQLFILVQYILVIEASHASAVLSKFRIFCELTH